MSGTVGRMPVGRVDRQATFFRKPKFSLSCDAHGLLGYFDTQDQASRRFQVHCEAIEHDTPEYFAPRPVPSGLWLPTDALREARKRAQRALSYPTTDGEVRDALRALLEAVNAAPAPSPQTHEQEQP